MAVWTDIDTARLEPGKPARSIDAIALRDNPIAIAEGAAGAPRIQTNGIATKAVTNEKINTMEYSKLTGKPTIVAEWSGAEYSMLAGGGSTVRVPSGYAMTGVELNSYDPDVRGSPYVDRIYARKFRVVL